MKHAYFASGFRESRGKHTGTKSNAYTVRSLYPKVAVNYVEYNDEPRKYAQDLASQWEVGDKLVVCGYSWGCGKWVRRFLWELHKLNPTIKVNHLILVDPVIYTEFFGLRWWAITDWGTISLPANINHCSVFYQRVDEPNASTLSFKGGCIPMYSEVEVPHTKIDNSSDVRNMVLKVAATYLS